MPQANCIEKILLLAAICIDVVALCKHLHLANWYIEIGPQGLNNATGLNPAQSIPSATRIALEYEWEADSQTLRKRGIDMQSLAQYLQAAFMEELQCSLAVSLESFQATVM